MNTPIRKGKVYLMGAGPGNPDLLTVQAVRILRTAEVVLHDHLVSQEILDLLPAWTQVRNVGKRCGHAGISQEQIHALLIAAAREGKHVVRLKGGDPLLFGRVGEEMEALARAGVEFEVVPGVTSAMGAAAAAKLPLTDRRYASRLIFVSNHSAGNVSPEWNDAVVKDATYAVYMPGKNYGEIAAKMIEGGLDAATPCVIVANATQVGEQVQRTTLQELALEQRLPAPSLLIVGEVARPLPAIQEDEEDTGWSAPKPKEVILDLGETRVQEEIIG
ncbi:MAG TPA: uroporphyrinogen-III C-methyltransferase [Candidatus Angelobacter sp.]|nr:uroporphyrinogen-III C-methyltransferase [Candidatus Angelobacter sp.]